MSFGSSTRVDTAMPVALYARISLFSQHWDMKAGQAFLCFVKAVTSLTLDQVTTDSHDSFSWAIRTELGKALRH